MQNRYIHFCLSLRLKLLRSKENDKIFFFHPNFKDIIPCYVTSEVSLIRFYFVLSDDGLTLNLWNWRNWFLHSKSSYADNYSLKHYIYTFGLYWLIQCMWRCIDIIIEPCSDFFRLIFQTCSPRQKITALMTYGGTLLSNTIERSTTLSSQWLRTESETWIPSVIRLRIDISSLDIFTSAAVRFGL